MPEPRDEPTTPAGWIKCDVILPVLRVRFELAGTSCKLIVEGNEGNIFDVKLGANKSDRLMWQLIQLRAQQGDTAARAIVESIPSPMQSLNLDA